MATGNAAASRAGESTGLVLDDIIQGSPVPTFVIDRDHRVVHWNRACEVILGYPADRMLGTRDQWKAFYPSERPVMADLVLSGEIESLIGRYYEGKFRRSVIVPGTFEAEDFFPEIGQGTWLYFSAAPVRDDSGQVVGAIETLQDITAKKQAEQAEALAKQRLQVSHDRLKKIIEHFPCGVSVLDEQLNLVEYNAEFKRLLDFPDTLFEQDRTPLERFFRFNAMRGEYGECDVEARVADLMTRVSRLESHSFERTRPNGAIIEVRGAPLPGGGMISSYTDVTERRNIEKRVEELLVEHQLIFDNAQVGIVWLRDRKVVNCNRRMAEIFGYPSADVLLGESTRCFYPSDEAWQQDGVVGYGELAAKTAIEGEATLYCRSDGTPLQVFRTGRLLKQGDPQAGSIWTFTDITEFKRQEKALQLAGMVFDNASEAFVVTDAQVRIVTVNKAFERMTGYSRAEVQGKNPSVLQSHRHGADFYREMWGALGRDGKWAGEIWDRHRDGTIKPFWIAIAVVRNAAGEIVNYISTFSDISARKKAEAELLELNAQLEQRVLQRTEELQRALDTVRKTQEELARADRMAALGSLVAGVSHELNTPIGNCVMVASTLLEQTDSFRRNWQTAPLKRSQFDEYLASMHSAAELMLRGMQRAQRLMAEFKQVASDQSGEQRRKFDISEVVSGMVSLLQPTLRKHGVSLQLDLPEGGACDGFPGYLEQVINNFVQNALLHAFEGRAGGQIRVSVELTKDDVALSFCDNGVGIPDDVQKRVFDPFFTTKLGQGGTGLGLNIVYNMVTGPLGGAIELHSKEGAGTTFRVVVPRIAPAKSGNG